MSLTVAKRLADARTKYVPRLEGEAERAWVRGGLADLLRATWPVVADDLAAEAHGAHTRFKRSYPHFILDVVAWCEDHEANGRTFLTPEKLEARRAWFKEKGYSGADDILAKRPVLQPFHGVSTLAPNVIAFADLLRSLSPSAASTFLAIHPMPVTQASLLALADATGWLFSP